MRIWPFITRRVYTLGGKQVIWLARMHRKGLLFRKQLLKPEEVSFWKTQSYNRYIGLSFAVGAAIFAVASVLMFCSLVWPALNNITNVTYFVGSVPFTLAASLQHFQSANMSALPDDTRSKIASARLNLIGWQPRNAGWWSTFSQWLGTIAFNISTFNAIVASNLPALDTLAIWAPNFEGSVLFLVSGYLAFIEVSNKYWSWRPKSLSWQVVAINLLGCIAFMISAISPTPPQPDTFIWVLTYSNTYTLIGAVCFFISALLLIKESEQAAE